MIDKKKLLKSVKEEYPFISEEFYKMLENFPEEPEIDFDALYTEFFRTAEANCFAFSPFGFRDFLKSKHISSQKPKQLPVKKVWTLKKEYEDFCTEFLLQSVKTVMSVEPVGASKKYYDYTGTPDYSQVNVGDVVEIHHSLSKSPNYGIVQENSNNILSIVGKIENINAFCIHYSHIKSLTILKAAE